MYSNQEPCQEDSSLVDFGFNKITLRHNVPSKGVVSMSGTVGIIPLILQSLLKLHIVSPVAQRALKLYSIHRPQDSNNLLSLSHYQIYDDFTEQFAISFLKDPSLVVVSPRLSEYLPSDNKAMPSDHLFDETETRQATYDGTPIVEAYLKWPAKSPENYAALSHLSPSICKSIFPRVIHTENRVSCALTFCIAVDPFGRQLYQLEPISKEIAASAQWRIAKPQPLLSGPVSVDEILDMLVGQKGIDDLDFTVDKSTGMVTIVLYSMKCRIKISKDGRLYVLECVDPNRLNEVKFLLTSLLK